MAKKTMSPKTMKKKINKYFVFVITFTLLVFSHANYAQINHQDQSLADVLETERLQKKAQDAQEKTMRMNNKIKKDNCAQAKSRLEVLTTKSRIRINTNDGVKLLSEEERQGEIMAAKSAIKTFCSN